MEDGLFFDRIDVFGVDPVISETVESAFSVFLGFAVAAFALRYFTMMFAEQALGEFCFRIEDFKEKSRVHGITLMGITGGPNTFLGCFP